MFLYWKEIDRTLRAALLAVHAFTSIGLLRLEYGSLEAATLEGMVLAVRQLFQLLERACDLQAPLYTPEPAMEHLNELTQPGIVSSSLQASTFGWHFKITKEVRSMSTTQDLIKAVKALENLLQEEVEGPNQPPTRLSLYNSLAMLRHLGNTALVLQQQKSIEETNFILEPKIVTRFERQENMRDVYERKQNTSRTPNSKPRPRGQRHSYSSREPCRTTRRRRKSPL